VRRPRSSGIATATVGTACFSVHSLSRASAIRRVVMPMTTTTRASTASASPVKPILRRGSTGTAGGGSGACCSG
jgi:hypothetical protein